MTVPEDENLAARIERLRDGVTATVLGVFACLVISTMTLVFVLLSAPRR